MRKLFIAFAFLVCVPQLIWASGVEEERRLSAEINRLGNLIVQKNFEPITVQAEGKDLNEAIMKVTAIVRDHISIRDLSPEICKCLPNHDIILPELCTLIMAWDYTLTETGAGDDKTVSLVVSLAQRELKQLALFQMWPLFGDELLKRALT